MKTNMKSILWGTMSLVALMLSLLVITGCSKSDEEPGGKELTITSFSPTKAKHGTNLTITGSGFSTTASENSVMLNSVAATVTSASSTKLIVTVPKDKNCSGELTVSVGGKNFTVAEPFTYELTYTVSTYAGSGTKGYLDGNAAEAQFNFPQGIAFDNAGNLYVSDYFNHRIRKITPAGTVSTLAGSGEIGFVDGTGASAKFRLPSGLATDNAGNIYVTEESNNSVRKITSAGVVTTVAGIGTEGSANGDALTEAQFKKPSGIAIDPSGNIYVGDSFNYLVRKISPGGVVSTLAGTGSQGYNDGNGTAAGFGEPKGLTIGSDGNIYVADYMANCIRKITPAGNVSTFAGKGEIFAGGFEDGNATTEAKFSRPFDLTFDAEGNMYVADMVNHSIRKITPAGVVATIAGTGISGYVDGDGSVAQFIEPYYIALDALGNIYVTDANHRIRKIVAE